MKKILFVVMISLGFFAIPGCKDDKKEEGRADKKNEISVTEVPAVVTEAFKSKYPQATEIIWETAHEKDLETYKVKFKQDSVYMKAEFGKDGMFIKENKDN